MNEKYNPNYKSEISIEDYKKKFQDTILDPDAFWEKEANRLHWYKRWTSVSNVDYEKADIKWFEGGTLNACYNCLDRNIENGNGDKTAIIWEGNDTDSSYEVSYAKLLDDVYVFPSSQV